MKRLTGTAVVAAAVVAVSVVSATVVAGGVVLSTAGVASAHQWPARTPAAPKLVRVSSDTIHASGEHATEAEPDTLAVGHSVLSSFMVGNVPACTDDIGWAFSRDGGRTWRHGLLPGLTRYSTPPGKEASVADTTDAWDAKGRRWLVSALNCTGPGGVTVSASTNGTTWSNPVTVVQGTGKEVLDKDWLTCDDHPASPFYGHCYAEWDLVNKGFQVQMSTSADGGKTWSAPVSTAGSFRGVGAEPIVLPNGTVVVPCPNVQGAKAKSDGAFGSGDLDVFTSTNGGKTWGAAQTITTFHRHAMSGNLLNLRLPFFPAQGMDAAGRIYLAFPDCRFHPGCTTDDMVMTTSTDGTHWTRVTRIPLAAATSTEDIWGGGLAVDPSTSGSTARLGVYYYYFSAVPCTVSTCRVFLAYASSANGGKTWASAQVVAGPMRLRQFGDPFAAGPGRGPGGFAGDYVGASAVPGGNAVAVLPLGLAPTTQEFNEPMETVAGGEPITGH